MYRKQKVFINNESSNWTNVLSGVPQGSVLGPILFIIYINDLEEGLYSKVLKFPDDIKPAHRESLDGENAWGSAGVP